MMKTAVRNLGIKLILVGVLLSSAGASARLNRGNWIGSVGMGIMVSPSVFLLQPQMEYVYRRNLFMGPLLQAGIGSGALIGASFTMRLMLGEHPRLRPSLEGGLGLAASSGYFASSIGVLIHMGMGFDYLIDNHMSLGTVVRANFAPPMQTFFLSWPIFVFRYIL